MKSNEKINHGSMLVRRVGSNKKAMEKMIALRNAAYERGGNYLCELCGHTVSTCGGLSSHLYRTHDMKVSEYKMAVALNKPDISELPVVKKTLLTYGYQDCELCDWTGVKYSSFANHLRRRHSLSVSGYREKTKPKT